MNEIYIILCCDLDLSNSDVMPSGYTEKSMADQNCERFQTQDPQHKYVVRSLGVIAKE